MSRIEIDLEGALRQASMTGDHYLNCAIEILNKMEYTWKISDAIELAKIMAQDYDSTLKGIKMQELTSALHEIAHQLSMICP